jgi:phospholipid transport system substrate-binding protein
MKIRRPIRVALAAAAFMAAGWVSVAYATLDETAGPFVDDVGHRVIAVFVDGNATREEKADRFKTIFHDGFAVKALAAFTLGHYYKGTDKAFIDEYLKVFDEYITLSYLARFSGGATPIFKVVDVVPDNDGNGKKVGVLVKTNISRTGGKPTEVLWRVREHNGKPIIVDVYAEGVSLANTQQREFTSVISNNGGDVRALLKVLRRKVAEMRAN